LIMAMLYYTCSLTRTTMPKIGFTTPTLPKRVGGGIDNAKHYLKHLSGDDVSDKTIAVDAALWGVDLSKFKTRHDKVLAIASAVACYSWDRADDNYAEYTLLPDDAKDFWVKRREINSARDMEKLPDEMQAFLKEHGLEKPVHSSQLSADEMKAYMADRGMELPVKAIQNVFTQIRKGLNELGMTWVSGYIHEKRTKELKAEQAQVAEADFMKGPIKRDSRPLTAWADEELLSPSDDVGQIAVAFEHSTGLRCDEGSSPKYIVTKHSEYGIYISDLGKKRAGSSNSSSEIESGSESSEITGYDFTRGSLQTDDGRYIVVCLAPADNVIAALTKLRELSSSMSQSTYYKRVRRALDTLDVLAPLREAWHFNKGFTLHAMRSTYIDALLYKLGSLGLWPEGAAQAEFTKKFLHHEDLRSSTAYGRMMHVESDEETEIAEASGSAFAVEAVEETPAETPAETPTEAVEVPKVAEPAAAVEVVAAESAVAEVPVVDTVDIDHDIALAELNVALHKGIVELHKGIVAVTRSEIALLVLRKRKRDAI
jgi:hypothetical protein